MGTNISVSETPSIDQLRSTWTQTLVMLEHLVETLPEPYKTHFDSPIKLLLGNKVSLAIIPPHHMWSYIQDTQVIYNLLLNIDYLGYDLDFILMEYFDPFLTRVSLSQAVNGALLREINRQRIEQRQEVVGIPEGATMEGAK